MAKCKGCGVNLQNIDENKIGYSSSIDSDYCLRCFRIKNYNDYKLVDKDNKEFLNIINNIEDDNLVVLVLDILNIGNILDSLKIKNKVLLVITKYDLLPIYEEKIKDYINTKLNIIDTVIISSKNNYNYDLLYDKLNKYKTDKVYFIGLTNAGKSSIINKLIYNYGNKDINITTSYLPSTTLDTIEIDFDDYKLIDTPGLLEEGNIIEYVSKEQLKRIIPKSKINPKIYQINSDQIINVDDILLLDVKKNNIISFYMSNNLNYKRIYNNIKTDLEKHIINVEDNTDIVINGLGFIKIKNKSKIILYTLKNVSVYTRKSLI